MSRMQKANQVLPADFASLLKRMARERLPSQVDSLLLAAHEAGWTCQALSLPFGCSREWIRKRVERAYPNASLPAVPAPPNVPEPEPKEDLRRRLTGEQVSELRALAQIAATVNGAMDSGHPSRRTGERFTALLAAYIEQGFAIYYLAGELGVTHGAITSRLARHGYRAPSPSLAGQVYRNRKVGSAA